MDLQHLRYQLRSGQYYLYDMREQPNAVTGTRRFKLKTDHVAIAFNLHTGEVHQHGSPLRIQSWALTMCRRLRLAGLWDEADGIVVVSGPLPVDEINKCLWIRGYCRRMFQRLATLPHGKLQAASERASTHSHDRYDRYRQQAAA
ncbi:hypothetical protein [Comamonas sp. GB3 AK4-5]|uniref:hypothetical protein n=1 Tax=Comamonas sp. GB3 AK4-5 TaxID=3231487 RepID=UPI00351E4121